VSTTIFSRIMIGRKILRHHALGCVFSAIGFVIVGFAASMSSDSGDSKYTPQGIMLGTILSLIYLIIVAIQSNLEEYIVTKNAIHVQRMIGLEGMFGIIWALFGCTIFSFVACPNDEICDVPLYVI